MRSDPQHIVAAETGVSLAHLSSVPGFAITHVQQSALRREFPYSRVDLGLSWLPSQEVAVDDEPSTGTVVPMLKVKQLALQPHALGRRTRHRNGS